MSDIDEVNEVVQDARRALLQMPCDHPDRAAYLDELGVALGDRFSITRDANDLEEAVRVSGEAVSTTPMNSPDRAGRLSNYGIRLAERHSMTEEISDIRCAINIMRQALDITPDGDSDRAMYLNNLGTALADKYAQTSSMADLDASIEITQQAITSAADDSDLPMYLNSLALRLGDRYERTGEGLDLDAALSAIRKAIDLTPSDSSDRDLYLNTLVIQLGHQYSRTGKMDYLYESIRVAQDIVDTTPSDDPDRPMYLNTLGLSLGELYSVTYEDSYIENGIMALREALELMPEDSKKRAIYMHDLGNQFGRRYSKTGATADLRECIMLIRNAIKRVATDHSDRPGWLSNLGVRLGEGFLGGDTTDIEQSIEVTREAIETTKVTTDKAMYLCNLGNRLGERYSRTGDTADIDTAIEVTQQAISLSPANSVTKATCLLNLGNRFGDKYDVDGEKGYLDESIRTLQQAVDMMPENHPGKATVLNSLGVRLAARYTSVSAIDDLESVIEVTRRAVVMTPKTSPTRGLYLHNLGAALGDKYNRMRSPSDLHEAIGLSREAVTTTPRGHPNRAMYLNGLAIRLGDRHSRNGACSMSDLDEIIEAATEAVDATPSIHTRRPVYLNSLGIRLMERYKRQNTRTDLDKAVRILQEAADTTPKNHPERARYLVNLGTGLDLRYAITGASTDHEGAISQLQSALREPNHPTIDRISAGIAILQICSTTSDWEQVCDALEVAVGLVPKLTARSLENPDKQHLLGQVVGLASNAAAAALYAGRGPVVALKFLEQGRGVLATALEEVRTDVVELQVRYPELAKRFITLRDELDSPGGRDTLHSDEHGGSDQARASRRYDAGNKLDELIAEIKRQPGFEDFLDAPSERDLLAAAKYGPVVVINNSEYRCDAILVEQHQMRSVPLPNNLEQEARTRDPRKMETLEWLWDTVAHPILDALGLTHRHDPLLEKWPRIWWVATGIMTKFPLHAAGRHEGISASVLDRAMSSYSSSIKAIIQSRRRGVGDAASGQNQALLVAMEHTPQQASLPFAAREIETIRELAKTMNLEPIEPEQHKHDIIAHLPHCKMFHFAGHGHTDDHDPMRSHLLLKDGKENPLTVANLLEVNLRKHLPFLAYLSACGTGRIEDKRFVDESIHLISACQLAGFRHVIGTLWEVNDELCVDMARITYQGIRDGSMTDESVCLGLHNASRQLRDEWRNMSMPSVGKSATEGDGRLRDVIACDDEISPLHWVPYVHFGV